MAKPIESATLTWRRDLNDTLAIFRFDLENGVPDFEPGQFITLGVPDEESDKPGKMIWRAYSIASPPSVKEHLELYIRRPLAPIPGRLTSALWEMPIGAAISHRGITGPFTIEHELPSGEPDLRTLLLVAGGTGVAPYVPYCVELERSRTPRHAVVVHGASYIEELGYNELFADMASRTSNAGEGAFKLTYVPTISRPKEEKNAGWVGETGRAEMLLTPGEDDSPSRLERMLGERITPDRFFVHVCGYDGTCKATQAVLEPRDFRGFRNRHEDGSYDYKIESYG